MKVFNLRCQFGHDFEGWFGSSEDFDQQRRNRLLCCPICESAQVERLPSAPRLNLGAQEPAAKATGGSAVAASKNVTNLPAEQLNWMQAVRELTEKVLSHTEDVGQGFAEEARRIHYHEAPERAIRGTTTERERHALEEEGIAVLNIPVLPVFKDTLQ